MRVRSPVVNSVIELLFQYVYPNFSKIYKLSHKRCPMNITKYQSEQSGKENQSKCVHWPSKSSHILIRRSSSAQFPSSDHQSKEKLKALKARLRGNVTTDIVSREDVLEFPYFKLISSYADRF
ncbi:hypothetical protein FGO68_gene6811 [Halteria grandinella]|uniref:Uncharacterized protein n=1 Tax=Halteria grandinella TaxID=5974 RepID=A0A8J8N8Y1_HALGN|nr:hypothetical protein FGO68_gene6811 [Halteria grandinella]